MADAGRDRGGVLVVRVWEEPDAPGLRARLIESTWEDPGGRVSVAVASGVDDICAALRAWLEQLTGPPTDGDGTVMAG